MKVTDYFGIGVTDIELTYCGYNKSLSDITGVEYYDYKTNHDIPWEEDDWLNDVYEVEEIDDCIYDALSWKYSVGIFSEDPLEKNKRRVYIDGKEIDASSKIARRLRCDGFEQEYKDRVDSICVNDQIEHFRNERYGNTAQEVAEEYKDKVSEAIISLASKGIGYKALKIFVDTCNGNILDAIPHMPDSELIKASKVTDDNMQEFANQCSEELKKRRVIAPEEKQKNKKSFLWWLFGNKD